MSVNIRWEKAGNWAVTYLQHGGRNLYNAEQFANWAQRYSLSKITMVSATQTHGQLNEERSGDYGHIGLYAQVFFRSAADNKLYAFLLPAPDESVFTDDQEVTEEWGIACAAQYSILAGTQFTFYKGSLIGHSL